MSKTVSALVLSAFEDASTGDRFSAGDTVPLERGVFDNFEAAGLVREADPTVKIEGHTIKTTGSLKVDGNLTVPAKPAPRKRTRAAK